MALAYWLEYVISVTSIKNKSSSWRIVSPRFLALVLAFFFLSPSTLFSTLDLIPSTYTTCLQPIGFQCVPCIIMLAVLPFIRESPRWLITKGRTTEALGNLAWVRKRGTEDPRVLEEYAEMAAAHQEEVE